MRAILLGTIACLALSACATTKNAKAEKTVNVRAAEIVEQTPIDIDALQTSAREYYAEGKFHAAINAYQQILVHAPKDFEDRSLIILGYADSALALSGEDKFLQKAEDAYALLGDEMELSSDLANRLLSGKVLLEIAKSDSPDAEVRLNEALESNLDDPRLWNALGHFHDQNDDWLIALETYVKALHVANNGGYPVAPVVNNMGMSLLLQKRTGEALEKFEQAHKMNPDVRIYDNNRRMALILAGRLDKASEGLNDKRAARIFNDAGYVSAMTGHKARAKYYYKKAIELSPTYFETAERNLATLTELRPDTEA
jgi:Flp pilus assembly protein TadD